MGKVADLDLSPEKKATLKNLAEILRLEIEEIGQRSLSLYYLCLSKSDSGKIVFVDYKGRESYRLAINKNPASKKEKLREALDLYVAVDRAIRAGFRVVVIDENRQLTKLDVAEFFR